MRRAERGRAAAMVAHARSVARAIRKVKPGTGTDVLRRVRGSLRAVTAPAAQCMEGVVSAHPRAMRHVCAGGFCRCRGIDRSRRGAGHAGRTVRALVAALRAATVGPHHQHDGDRAAGQDEHGRVECCLAPTRSPAGMRKGMSCCAGDRAANAAERVFEVQHGATKEEIRETDECRCLPAIILTMQSNRNIVCAASFPVLFLRRDSDRSMTGATKAR